jgi:hypothetical protein
MLGSSIQYIQSKKELVIFLDYRNNSDIFYSDIVEHIESVEYYDAEIVWKALYKEIYGVYPKFDTADWTIDDLKEDIALLDAEFRLSAIFPF